MHEKCLFGRIADFNNAPLPSDVYFIIAKSEILRDWTLVTLQDFDSATKATRQNTNISTKLQKVFSRYMFQTRKAKVGQCYLSESRT